MAFYKVINADWHLGGQAGKWYAFKGKMGLGKKADAGPFKTRAMAVRWIQENDN